MNPIGKVVAAAVVAVFGISGCSGTAVRPDQSLDQDAAAAPRDPSSQKISASNENEEAFQLMFSGDRTEASLFEKFSQIEEVFYRSHILTLEFDRMLAAASSSTDSSQDLFMKKAIEAGVYPKLVALQRLGEETNSRALYFIERMIELERNKRTPEASRAKVKATLAYVAKYLAQSPNSLRLALSPWAEMLHEKYPDLPGFQKAYDRLFVGDYAGLSAFAQEQGVQNHLEYLARKTTVRPGYLRERMNDIAKTLTPDLLEGVSTGRTPQSVSSKRAGVRLADGSYALVFEGPQSTARPNQILSTLNQKNVKATFFVQPTTNASLLKNLTSAGMTLGNGTMTRPELPKSFDHEMEVEIAQSGEQLQTLTGTKPELIKLPFNAGLRSRKVAVAVEANNLFVVTSRIESLSWNDFNADKIVSRIEKQMKLAKSGVLAMSSSQAASAAAVEKLLSKQNSTARFVDKIEVAK